MPEIKRETMTPEEAIQASAHRTGVQQAPLTQKAPEVTPPPDFPQPRPMPNAAAAMGGAPPVQQPQAAEDQKATGMGKVFQALMGKSVSYQTNPETGEIEPVATQRKPGEFFKAILAGALLGGAAGAEADSFAGGITRGGAAVGQDIERRDEQKYARAEKDVERQRQAAADKREEERLSLEQRRVQTEETVAGATVANMTATQLYNDKLLKLQSREHAVRLQQLNGDMQQRLIENAAKGIRAIDVPMNGKPGNGVEFMQDYLKNKGAGPYKAGSGKFMQLIASYDYDGLNFNPDSGVWQDEDGKTVDPADRATYTVYEVPMAAALDQISVPGSTLQDVYGVSVPERDNVYPVRIIDLLSFSLAKQKEIADSGKEAQAERRLNWQMSYQTLQAKRDSLENRRISIDRDEMMMPEQKRALQGPIDKEINETVTQMENVVYRMTNDGEEPPARQQKPLPKPTEPGETLTPEVALMYMDRYGTRQAAEEAAKLDGWSTDVIEGGKPKSTSMKQKIKDYLTDPERAKEAALTLLNPAFPATRAAGKKLIEMFEENE